MHTISGLLVYLQLRSPHLSTPLLLVMALGLMVVVMLSVVIAAQLLVASEPIISAPVRWGTRPR